MGWNTVSFIRAFMHGTLGRKRVHGSYRVLEGDHCMLLVRAKTAYGVPDGSELIAVNLSDEEERCVFFHFYNTNCFTYKMNKDLDVYNAPKLPTDVLDGDDSNLIASGIIEASDTQLLIELGDKPYLLHKKLTDNGNVVRYDSDHGTGVPMFSSLDKLESRVGSIKEAQETIKDPVGMEQLLECWWVDKQTETFTPPEVTPEVRATLISTINPMDYGFKLDECSVQAPSSYDDDAMANLVPNEGILEAGGSNARDYKIARAKWNAAMDTFKSRTPMEYKSLTTKSQRYSYGGQQTATGFIVRTQEGVFLKGQFRTTEDWSVTQTLDVWYKIHSRIMRIKLGC